MLGFRVGEWWLFFMVFIVFCLVLYVVTFCFCEHVFIFQGANSNKCVLLGFVRFC